MKLQSIATCCKAEVKVAEIGASSVRNRAIFRSGTVFEKLEY
jgi:hypothetical protein